jgi:hypothetical protein
MPPIVLFALGALAAGAIVHRRINAELDRVKEGRAIEPDGLPQKATGRSGAKAERPI